MLLEGLYNMQLELEGIEGTLTREHLGRLRHRTST